MSSTLRSALGNSNPNLGQTSDHMPVRTQNGKIQARTESVPRGLTELKQSSHLAHKTASMTENDGEN